MSELVRRDEHLMGDEGLASEPAASHGITSPYELPRDAHGRVIGTWHVITCEDAVVVEDRVGVVWKALEGDLVDRAISLGCAVAPGAYDGPEITLTE